MKYSAMQGIELEIVEEAESLMKAAKEEMDVDLSFSEALEVIKIHKLDNSDTQLDSIQYTIEEKRYITDYLSRINDK